MTANMRSASIQRSANGRAAGSAGCRVAPECQRVVSYQVATRDVCEVVRAQREMLGLPQCAHVRKDDV